MNAGSQSVFVTGGSGFIGRHLVEALLKHGYTVRVLARKQPEGLNPSVRVVLGDLTRPESFAAGLEGVSAVIHAALTDGLSQDVEATSKLHRLSAEAGVRQFLHLSTISVYGNPPSGTITEDTVPLGTSDPYASTKLAIEAALQTAPACPEVAVLRLGCVYGPVGGWWTQGLLNMMARGKVILVMWGAGYANLILVEDVAALLLVLLSRSNRAFEIYNVTDGQPIAWSRYYAEIEKLFGSSATVSMTAAQAREYGKKWLHPSLVRRLMRKAAIAPSIHPLDDKAIDGFASVAAFSNEKARMLLGFEPAYNFERGIESLRVG